MASSSNKPVIIEAALNGGTLKAANPHVPASTDELVRDGLACLEAGASVLHTHAPDPMLRAREAAAQYLEHFEPVLATYPEALVYQMSDSLDRILGRIS